MTAPEGARLLGRNGPARRPGPPLPDGQPARARPRPCDTGARNGGRDIERKGQSRGQGTGAAGKCRILEAGTPEDTKEFQSATRGLGLGESDAMIACRKARQQPEGARQARRARGQFCPRDQPGRRRGPEGRPRGPRRGRSRPWPGNRQPGRKAHADAHDRRSRGACGRTPTAGTGCSAGTFTAA